MWGQKQGIDIYITKPYSERDLVKAIDIYITKPYSAQDLVKEIESIVH